MENFNAFVARRIEKGEIRQLRVLDCSSWRRLFRVPITMRLQAEGDAGKQVAMGDAGQFYELDVRVIPNASRDEVTGWHAGALKIKTSVQPESGKANHAVCLLLAKQLGLPKGAVSVVNGKKSQMKQLRIESVRWESILARWPLD